MTNEELRVHLTYWAKEHCKDDLDGASPGGFDVFLHHAATFYEQAAVYLREGSKKSESLGDYSISMEDALGIAVATQGIPGHIKAMLAPYRRAGTLND